MTHKCTAYCGGDEHCSVLATTDNPPRGLIPGVVLLKGDKRIRLVRIEPASPEYEPEHPAPAGYTHNWLFWYTLL